MRLLDQLVGTEVAEVVKVLWFIGVNRFEERAELRRVFPNLEKTYLFEPLPESLEFLQREFNQDQQVSILGYAVSDYDGTAEFFVTNNSVSSSLLKLGKHSQVFPHVIHVRTITVEVRTVGTLLNTYNLPCPDFLLMDTQGAELKILSAIPDGVLAKIPLIVSEASLEELYCGSGTLEDIRRRLDKWFVFSGFEPLSGYSIHGDALFIHRTLSAGNRGAA